MSNVLPPQEKRTLIRLYRTRVLVVALAGVVALAAAAMLLAVPSLLVLKSRAQSLLANSDRLAGFESTTVAHMLSETTADINARLAALPAASVTPSPVIAGLIDPVLRAQTAKIHITDIGYTRMPKSKDAQVKITGIADDRDALLAFAAALGKSGAFTSVTVPLTNFIKDTDVPFTASAVAAAR